MSKFGGLMGKAKGLVSQNRDKVDAGLDKTGDIVDQKTGGEHHDKIEKALDKADEGLDKWAPDAKQAQQESAPPQDPPAGP